MGKAPLVGIRVLDLSRLLPGPYATMVLADLGADVIKIEDPRDGDYLRQIPPLKSGMSGRFHAVNRGKRSLVLDLKSDAGRDAFLRMARSADVVVESFRPGVMDRLGIGYGELSKRTPSLIHCSISGFGQTGPYAARAGHDVGYMAMAGALAMGGVAGGAPGLPGLQVADLAGGALWSVSAILAALFGRSQTGSGAQLDISMTDGALALLAAEIGNYDSGAPAPTRGETTLNGGVACYGIYETSDEKYLSVGSLEPKFWTAFNQAIGREGDVRELLLPADKQREIRDEIAAVIAAKTRAEWTATFAEVDCCVEPVLEVEELEASELHRARGRFFRIDLGDGEQALQVETPLGPPAKATPAPKQGEHSREILREYGFSEAEIDALA